MSTEMSPDSHQLGPSTAPGGEIAVTPEVITAPESWRTEDEERYQRYQKALRGIEELAEDAVTFANHTRQQLERLGDGSTLQLDSEQAEQPDEVIEARQRQLIRADYLHWTDVADSKIDELDTLYLSFAHGAYGSESRSIEDLTMAMVDIRFLMSTAINALSRGLRYRQQYNTSAANGHEVASSGEPFDVIDPYIVDSLLEKIRRYPDTMIAAISRQLSSQYTVIASEIWAEYRQSAYANHEIDNLTPDSANALSRLWPEIVANRNLWQSMDLVNGRLEQVSEQHPHINYYYDPLKQGNYALGLDYCVRLLDQIGAAVEQHSQNEISSSKVEVFKAQMSSHLVELLNSDLEDALEYRMQIVQSAYRGLVDSLPHQFPVLLISAIATSRGYVWWPGIASITRNYSIDQLLPGASLSEVAQLQQLFESIGQLDDDTLDAHDELIASAVEIVVAYFQHRGQSLTDPLTLYASLDERTYPVLSGPIRQELLSRDELDGSLVGAFVLRDAMARQDATLLQRLPQANFTLNTAVPHALSTGEDLRPAISLQELAFLVQHFGLDQDPTDGADADTAVTMLVSRVAAGDRQAAFDLIFDRYPDYGATLRLNSVDFRLSRLMALYQTEAALFPLLLDYVKNTPSDINGEIVDFFDQLGGEAMKYFRTILPQFTQFNQFDQHPDQAIQAIQEKLSLVRAFEGITSAELLRLKDDILQKLLLEEGAEGKLDQIIQIFEQNNTPDVAKIYLVFQTIYPQDELQQRLTSISSPVLNTASPRQRYGIIFRDLLKVHIDSVNPNLYGYLQRFAENQALLDSLDPSQLDQLDPQATQKLSQFLRRLETLHFTSALPAASFSQQPDLASQLTALRTALGATATQNLSDRIVEMYGKSLGYTTIEQVLQHGQQSITAADRRNRQYLEESGGVITVRAGDLLKGIDFNYLASMAVKGIVSKECLGANLHSDLTPFDTDLSLVSSEDVGGNTMAAGMSLAANYGSVILGIRNRGQFYETNAADTPNVYDPRYELFHSGPRGHSHMGVRTGMPFTEVDYILVDKQHMSTETINRLIFTVAQLPYYVPVAGIDGQLLFGPEDVETWRIDFESIQQSLTETQASGQDIVAALSQTPYLASQFRADAGVSEGYTLGRHTSMVIDQFGKYFDQVPTEGHAETWLPLSSQEFKFLLALHDIGKPEGLRVAGTTQAQHAQSREIVGLLLTYAPFAYDTRELMVSMVSQDLLGEYFKGQRDMPITAKRINHMAMEHGLSVERLLPLLLMYYLSDAGAYTSDAGGAPSLDRLFTFHSPQDGLPTIELNEPLNQKWQALWQAAAG